VYKQLIKTILTNTPKGIGLQKYALTIPPNIACPKLTTHIRNIRTNLFSRDISFDSLIIKMLQSGKDNIFKPKTC
jgi:hypothetical protein